MKKENLRKYKDTSSTHRLERDLITKPKRDEQWHIDQYNRNRAHEDHIDKICKEYPRQEEEYGLGMINHPTHYGGEDNTYEAIKVIEAWDLGFNLGNTIKYVSRAGKKIDILEDLEKASWYINREIKKLKNER